MSNEDDQKSEASASSNAKESVTLSRAELAYLNAMIEEMIEEKTGRTESVTVLVDPGMASARWTKLVVKVTKKVVKATRYTWVVTEAVDLIGGIFEAQSSTTATQRENLAKLKDQLRNQNSLEDLLELRRKFNASADSSKGGPAGSDPSC